MVVQSIDQVGDGYPLTGSIIGSDESDIIVGSNTLFLSEVAVGDTLVVADRELRVRRVIDNTHLLLSAELDGSLSANDVVVQPEREWYNTNRDFSIAGHTIKRAETTIDGRLDRRRIIVDDKSDFAKGEDISISGEIYTIDRLTSDVDGNNVIVLNRNTISK